MTKRTIELPTEGGRIVKAELDDANFQVAMARVINPATGARTMLSRDAAENIADLVRNEYRSQEAMAKMAQVFMNMPQGLQELARRDPANPGVEPYLEEADKHRALAQITAEAAENIRTKVTYTADRLASAEERAHLPNAGGNIREV